jgi:hypothetical protein
MDPNETVQSQFRLGSIDIGGIALLIALPIFWFLVPAFLRENGLSKQLSIVTNFEADLLRYGGNHKIFVLFLFVILVCRAASSAYRSGRKDSVKSDK